MYTTIGLFLSRHLINRTFSSHHTHTKPIIAHSLAKTRSTAGFDRAKIDFFHYIGLDSPPILSLFVLILVDSLRSMTRPKQNSVDPASDHHHLTLSQTVPASGLPEGDRTVSTAARPLSLLTD